MQTCFKSWPKFNRKLEISLSNNVSTNEKLQEQNSVRLAGHHEQPEVEIIYEKTLNAIIPEQEKIQGKTSNSFDPDWIPSRTTGTTSTSTCSVSDSDSSCAAFTPGISIPIGGDSINANAIYYYAANRYCSYCDIQFSSVNIYQAHKQYYCRSRSAPLLTGEQPPQQLPIEHSTISPAIPSSHLFPRPNSYSKRSASLASGPGSTPGGAIKCPRNRPKQFDKANQCRFCTDTFLSVSSRNRHEQRRHLLSNTKKYHCQFCTTRIIPCIGKFIKHLQDYHVSTKEVAYGYIFGFYACDEMNCDECFISHKLLETHIQKFHVKFNCTAEFCTHIFANKVNLDLHVKNVHSNNRHLACEYCHMDFRWQEDLEEHKEGHLVKITRLEYKCSLCEKEFRTERALISHKSYKHKEPGSTAPKSGPHWKCRLCKKEFSFDANVSLKRRMHEYKCNRVEYLAEKAFLCKICFLCFGTEQELNSHQKEIHDPNICKICNVQLLSAQGLAFHSLIHSSKGTSKSKKSMKDFTCDLCKLTFTNHTSLSVHNSVLHPEEKAKAKAAPKVVLKCNYGCEIEIFGNPYLKRRHHVNTHADIHLAGGSVYCKVCYEVFKGPEELAEHSLGHRTFRCKVCGKEFKSESILYEHKYVHLTNHPGFKCKTCDKVFKTPRKLTTHVNQAHLGKRSYKNNKKANCQHCRKVLVKGIPMNRHLYLNHKEEYLKIKPIFCNLCYAGFDTEQQLQKHLDTTHFKCQFCGRGFSTKYKVLSHENTHTGSQPFQCQICGKCFAHDPNLIAHMRTHKGQPAHKKKPKKVTT